MRYLPRGAEIQVSATIFVGRSHTEIARLIRVNSSRSRFGASTGFELTSARRSTRQSGQVTLETFGSPPRRGPLSGRRLRD